MSKIRIFSLGGLDEVGKNCYVVEVDNSIFVFDCGLKYAHENLYGIDYVIPSFEYLIKNKKRIRGLFLTHGHNENMGAVSDLVRDIPELKIYASKFTKYALLEDGVLEKNIIEIKANRAVKFGEVSVFPINVSHSAPDSLMYVLNTKDGAICYTGDFIIDPMMSGAYGTDLGKIAYVGKQKVLASLCESVLSEVRGHTSPKHRMTEFFKDVLNHHLDRMIFLVLASNLYTIQDIFNAVANRHRKVVVMGKKLQNLVNMAVREGYLDIPDNVLGDLSDIDTKGTILLVAEDRETPYASISKALNNYDKFIKLKPTDTVVFAVPKHDSSEKILVKIENELAVIGCNIVSIPKDKTLMLHASSEDLMVMMKLLNPKYFIPVKGDYRYMVGSADLAQKIGISKENILLKQNGEVIEFIDGENVECFDKIVVNDILIDGKSNDDVGALVIKDREMLGENGIVLISATISRREKVLLVGPTVTTRGFIYVRDSQEMIEEIKKICEVIIERNITTDYVEYNKIKTEIREELGKYLYHETECKPMIIAVVQEV